MTSQILIEITQNKDSNKVVVTATTDESVGFKELMIATEYLIHITAKQSGLPYREAIKKLTERAIEYYDLDSDKIIRL